MDKVQQPKTIAAKPVKLPTSFEPIVPIRTLEDLHHNLILFEQNFVETRKGFEQLNCGSLEVIFTPLNDVEPTGMVSAKFRVGEFTLVETQALEQKRAEVIAHRKFMKEMGKWCCRILRKKKPKLIAKVSSHETKVHDYNSHKIDKSNQGYKMLQKQGWDGGALGRKEDGILEPIAVQKGFHGFSQDQAKQFVERKKDLKFDLAYYRELIQKFSLNAVEYDLVFSARFTKEERAQLHHIAEEHGVQSRSFGKKNSRQLLLHGRCISMHEILQRVLIQEDSMLCEMYRVQLPKNLPQSYRTVPNEFK